MLIIFKYYTTTLYYFLFSFFFFFYLPSFFLFGWVNKEWDCGSGRCPLWCCLTSPYAPYVRGVLPLFLVYVHYLDLLIHSHLTYRYNTRLTWSVTRHCFLLARLSTSRMAIRPHLQRCRKTVEYEVSKKNFPSFLSPRVSLSIEYVDEVIPFKCRTMNITISLRSVADRLEITDYMFTY